MNPSLSVDLRFSESFVSWQFRSHYPPQYLYISQYWMCSPESRIIVGRSLYNTLPWLWWILKYNIYSVTAYFFCLCWDWSLHKVYEIKLGNILTSYIWCTLGNWPPKVQRVLRWLFSFSLARQNRIIMEMNLLDNFFGKVIIPRLFPILFRIMSFLIGEARHDAVAEHSTFRWLAEDDLMILGSSYTHI